MNVIYLRVTSENNEKELKIIIEEKESWGESTLQQYVRAEISFSKIHSISSEIFSLLYQFSRSSHTYMTGNGRRLVKLGQHLYDSIFPLQIKERLANIKLKDLCIVIDDSLISIPWEILHDGEGFWGLSYNMGRVVTTSQYFYRPKRSEYYERLKMLLLADPREDLPNSCQEGILLNQELSKQADFIDCFLELRKIDTTKILREISQYHIVHYAGHAKYDQENPGLSGWCLKDGILTAQEILKVSGGKKSFPSLIFSNACSSGHTSKWPDMAGHKDINRAYDLVNAFLRSGAQHYIGTFQDIIDPSSLDISLYFYQYLMSHNSIGESLRKARLEVIKKYGADNLIWAFYMMYGDPTICYLKPVKGGGEECLPEGHLQSSKKQLEEGKQSVARPLISDLDLARPVTTTRAARERKTGDNVQIHSQEPAREVKGYKQGSSKKKRVVFSIAGLLLLILLSGLLYCITRRQTQGEEAAIVTPQEGRNWERQKWRIVREIQEKLEQRIREGKITNVPSPISNSGNTISTLCIIPDNKHFNTDTRAHLLTGDVIQCMNEFWLRKPGYSLLERERLDFVLDELSRAASGLSNEKLKFTLGKIFGVKNLLFVEVIPYNYKYLLPFFSRQIKVRLRLVDVETSQVLDTCQGSVRDTKGLNKLCQDLSEELLRTLENKNRRGGQT